MKELFVDSELERELSYAWQREGRLNTATGKRRVAQIGDPQVTLTLLAAAVKGVHRFLPSAGQLSQEQRSRCSSHQVRQTSRSQKYYVARVRQPRNSH